MNKDLKMKFNILDILVLSAVILVILAFILQSFAVRRFENRNRITNTVITLRVSDITGEDFETLVKETKIYSEEKFGQGHFGTVAKNSVLTAEDVAQDDTEEFELKINAACHVTEDEFYSIDDDPVYPGLIFAADNGRIKFTCEVVSIKIEK